MLDIAKDALAQKSRVEIRSELYYVEGRTDDVVLGGWKRREEANGQQQPLPRLAGTTSSHLVWYLPITLLCLSSNTVKIGTLICSRQEQLASIYLAVFLLFL